MANQQLPQEVVNEDHRLREAEKRSSEELAQLRWHWTLGPGGELADGKRRTFTEYARQVGVTEYNIRSYASGWDRKLNSYHDTNSMSDHIRLATKSESRQIATQAVADTQGRTVTAITNDREMRQVAKEVEAEVAVRETDHAEEHGTTEGFDAEKEARKIAQAKSDLRKIRHAQPTGPSIMDNAGTAVADLAEAALSLNRAAESLKLKPDYDDKTRRNLMKSWKSVRKWYRAVEMAVETFETDLDTELADLLDGGA